MLTSARNLLPRLAIAIKCLLNQGEKLIASFGQMNRLDAVIGGIAFGFNKAKGKVAIALAFLAEHINSTADSSKGAAQFTG